MTLTELSIRKPILILVGFLVLGILGAFGYSQLSYELLPKLATPYVSVSTVYPGAAPAEIENTITKVIEDGIAGVSNVKRITSNSTEGLSIVTVEFVAGTNDDIAVQDVQRLLNQVLDQLPAAAKTPIVSRFSLSELPVLRIAVSANLSPSELSRLVKDEIKPRLAQIPGAGQVAITGNRNREIQVQLSPERLEAFNTSVGEVYEALRRANQEVPVGNLNDPAGKIGVRIPAKADQVARLTTLIVARRANGAPVYLRDVATVVDTTEEVSTINRFNGQTTIGIAISKQANANAVELSQRGRALLAQLTTEYKPVHLQFQVAQDSSEFTLDAADHVKLDLYIAIVLVAAVMLVFLHSLRNSFIVLVAIPASLLSTFLVMWLMGLSLNLMTLLAMSLVIGILVDDSIVVLENIHRHLEMGKDSWRASIDGRNEIGFSAISITLVDVVVFLPLAFVPGLVGSIVKEFAVVVVVSTLFSLLVCFTLTPMMASRFAKAEHLSARTLWGRMLIAFEGMLNRLTDWYAGILRWSLRNRLVTALIALTLLVASLALPIYGYVGSEFAPATDKGELALAITLEPGTRLARTDRVVRDLERQVRRLPEVASLSATVGSANGDFVVINGEHVAELNIVLKPKQARQRSARQVGDDLRQMAQTIPGAKVRVSAIGIFGTGNSSPIAILVTGQNRDSVYAGAQRLLQVVRNVPGTADVRLNLDEGQPEIHVELDRERLARTGLTAEEIGVATRIALTGDNDIKFSEAGKEYPVRVQFAADARSSIEALRQLKYVNAEGQRIGLTDFASLDLRTSLSSLDRRNKAAAITLYAEVKGRTSGEVGADIMAAMNQTPMPQGTTLAYEGDLELQDESFDKLLLAFAAAILFVYLIMVALYNSFVYPFVVLFSIPVALIGALLALTLTMKTLSIFSIFGIIMMVGLVAKNAILLVDRANQMRAEGHDLHEALLDAGRTRLRPILMTTLAMVVGMLPIALGEGGAAELKSGLGWALIGGLTSSMFLTLVLVPTVYYDVARLVASLGGKRSSAATTVAGALVAGLMLWPSTSRGQSQANDTLRLSLKAALERAATENPQLLQQRLEVAANQERLRQAKGLWLPEVSAQSQYTRYFKSPVSFFPEPVVTAEGGLAFSSTLTPLRIAARHGAMITGSLTQPLLRLETGATVTLARLRQQIAATDLQHQERVVQANVYLAYAACLTSRAAERLAAEVRQRAIASLADSKRLLERGIVAAADTLQARADWLTAQNSLNEAQLTIARTDADLRLLLNLPEAVHLWLVDSLPGLHPPSLAFGSQSLDRDRPDLRSQELEMQAAEANVWLTQTRRFPTIQGVAQIQTESQTDVFNRFDRLRWPASYFAGVQVNIPLFNGFRNQAAAEEARIQAQQARARYGQALRQAQSELELARKGLLTALAVEELQAAARAQTNEAFRHMENRYRLGLVRRSELDNARLTWRQAEFNWLQTQQNRVAAAIQFTLLAHGRRLIDAP